MALRTLLSKWLGPQLASQPPEESTNETYDAGLLFPHREGESSAVRDSHEVLGLPYDENLLERTRNLWCRGEWESLVRLDMDRLEYHPERARLSLAVASAWLQYGDPASARRYLDHAIDWGCDKKLVTQMLIAGVHNTLGRAAAITGDQRRLERHFNEALKGGGSASERTTRQRCQRELQRIGIEPAEGQPPPPPANSVGQHPAASSVVPPQKHDDGFYRAFEERFRGSRALIKQRVAVYLPFVQPIAERHPGMTVLDLGCGRGEWLEVLKEAGIDGEGVDIDVNMLEGCAELGLRISQGDALEYLRKQPDASRICISLMHVVEHIPFEILQRIVQETRRVLVSDGLLIMETPNPENFTVGSCNFYMDPTHRNPIPPPLLGFVPEHYGFKRVKIIRLQEESSLTKKETFETSDYLTNISPDYAVLAQIEKPTISEEKNNGELAAWSKEYGISLDFMLATNSSMQNKGF